VIAVKIIGLMLAIAMQAGQLGTTAPDFKLKDLRGKEFKSSQFKGSVVVLDLWATWCEPCIEDIPMFNRLHDKYASQNVKVVGIAVQSGWPADIKRHVAQLGIKYLVLAGDDKVAEQYLTVGFPTTYLLGPNGTIIKKYIGTVPDGQTSKEMDLEREIDKVLMAR
jgi:thiol-disulfide isomerase/thioredoxin